MDEVEIDFSPLRASLDAVEPLMGRADELVSGLRDQTSVLTETDGEGAPRKPFDGMMEERGSGDSFEGFEEEWSEDPNERPIWALPVVCRVRSTCEKRIP